MTITDTGALLLQTDSGVSFKSTFIRYLIKGSSLSCKFNEQESASYSMTIYSGCKPFQKLQPYFNLNVTNMFCPKISNMDALIPCVNYQDGKNWVGWGLLNLFYLHLLFTAAAHYLKIFLPYSKYWISWQIQPKLLLDIIPWRCMDMAIWAMNWDIFHPVPLLKLIQIRRQIPSRHWSGWRTQMLN